MADWSYSRCAACPNLHRQVMPDGPVDAKVMLVGESPGFNEDKSGIPFYGRSGMELNETYLPLAGLDRADVFVTNAVSCRCERNGVDARPGEALLATCSANHLPEEIWTVNPSVIILCGATACSLLNGSGGIATGSQPDRAGSQPDRIELELDHGFPRQVENCAGLAGWSGTVVPMYHPAAGLREARFMIPLLEDFERLGRWMRGKWDRPVWPVVKQPKYRLFDTADLGYLGSEMMAIDTESDEGRLWSIQWSSMPGTGGMVLMDNTDGIVALREWIHQHNPTIIMHNALYDLEMLAQVGIKVRRLRDTQQEIYHLAGSLPQGLKAAVYRVTGYRMTSYDEVVTPYSKAALEDWLAQALGKVSMAWAEAIPHPVGKDCPTCGKTHRKDVSAWRPHEAVNVVRRILGKVQEGDDSTYDPWQKPKLEKGEEKPRLLGREWLEQLETLIGYRMPRKSIVHAPLEKAVQYGVSDADWTGRLAIWLEGERKRIVEEEWSVA